MASRPNQLVLLDKTHTWHDHGFAWAEAHTPPTWKHPVDYYNGTVRVRIEVMEKPDDTTPCSVLLRLLSRHDRQCLVRFGMSVTFSTTGVFYGTETVRNAPSLVEPNLFDWECPEYECQVVVADATGHSVHPSFEVDMKPEWAGYPDLGLYVPLRARCTFVAVAAGAVFEPPDFWGEV